MRKNIRDLKPRRQRQRERHQTKILMSRTMAATRALQVFAYFVAVPCNRDRGDDGRNSVNLAQGKHAPSAFNSKRRYQKLAIVACILQNTQNLVISSCCFAEDGKEMCKNSNARAHL